MVSTPTALARDDPQIYNLRSVRDYDISLAQLNVEHTYPTEDPPTCVVRVDLSLVLETVHRDALDTGSWVNIIGYVKVSTSGKNKRKRSSHIEVNPTPEVVVQAVLLWTAGSLRIGEYERALERQKDERKKAIETIASYNQTNGRAPY
jgi:Telomere capping, CST complex subunit